MIQFLRRSAYAVYTYRLRSKLADSVLPRHVAIVMDGNRRWARQMGFDNPNVGHRYGAEHIDEVLGWCTEIGIERVTIFVASIDNLRKRASDEVHHLMQMIEEVVAERIKRDTSLWRLHVAGRLETLPDSTHHALKAAVEATQDRNASFHLTIAVGYDGREEIVDAIRSVLDEQAQAGATLEDVAQRLTADDIAAHLYTSGHPDPDLIIRTSGEQRMSGFLVWQAAYSELYFCDVYWPGFRKVDFLRALRAYAGRNRRLGA